MTTDVDSFLAHYGVKGMKWGVRRQRNYDRYKRVANKQASKRDKLTVGMQLGGHDVILGRGVAGGAQRVLNRHDRRFERVATNRKNAIAMWNTASSAANRDLPGINNRYRGMNLTDPNSPDAQRYHLEVLQNFNQHLDTASRNLGLNPSGTRRVQAQLLVREDGSPYGVHMSVVEVEHASLTEDGLNLRYIFDDAGFVIRMEVPNELKQAEAIDDFLEHYGVKGMKWGKRKSRSERTRYATGPKKLTSKELDKRIKRLETEKRYNELNKRDVSQGERLATEILTNVGRATVTTVATGAALYGVQRLLIAQGVDAQAVRGMTRRGK